jgi:hypothetical protein
MKTLGVYTKDFSLYHDLLKVLGKRKIPYVSLSSIHHIPSKIGVILTSNNELHDVKSQKVIAADAYDTIDHAVDLALQMLILLQKTDVENPEKVSDIVKRFLREYPAVQTLIRIGHGSIITRNRIINSLIPLEVPIEIVDETKTTSSQQTSRYERDSEAAASIALICGGKVQSRLPLEPTKGDIHNIQERSRKLTNGRFSISEKTALDVLNGKISLTEAIELEKDVKKHKRL